ncbi:MAG: GH1 family beta-glucosidase [Planctomycetota bacterium]|nr:GH1 family beta-glucosidase [Planctomycetota bacterium]
MSTEFPPGFVWGAATSSYQIEGSSGEQERGRSVWDAFVARPGAVYSGHTGEVACDHVRRLDEDLGLMEAMGLGAYRFSVSWPRVVPQGLGRVNDRGLDFYDRLVDGLLARGITPWATLFHWDYPLALYHRGGWLNRESASWFAEYAGRVAARLSDRVTHWMTINEPQVVAQLGHADGTHAPGVRLSRAEQLTVVHNMLRAHGLGTQAIRAGATRPVRVGWAPVGHIASPADEDPATIEAARAETFRVKRENLWNNTWFSDPVCLGRYPEDGLHAYAGSLPEIHAGDMESICQPLDFYGVNIYSGSLVRRGANGAAEAVPTPPGAARTSFNWFVTPEVLRWGPRFIFERYRLPVVITENGMANLDWMTSEGEVPDAQRIDFTRRYLRALHQAIRDGADVRGYFHWSLMDNFEWAEGYKERFGLIYVDFPSQERTLKLSAHWYRTVIESNGRALAGPSPVRAIDA